MHLINGQLVDEKDLCLPVRDLGLLRGYAVFDFFVTYKNRPFRLDDRIERLFFSASEIGLEIPVSKEVIKDWVQKVLNSNPTDFEKMIKILVTGGVSSNGFFPDGEGNVVILVDKRTTPDQQKYLRGIKVISDKYLRYSPKAKTVHYIEAVKMAKKMRQSGAEEILFFDDTQVYELSKSNIFALINDRLLTPKNNILCGITRKILLEILKLEVPVLEEDFTMDQLLAAKEVFMTNSRGEVTPIVQIDDRKIADGLVGEITKEAMRQFKEYTESELW